ncbi:MAG: hypothetical protein JJU33_12565 [Phycisphaerales bacterium]|nr:hypothetical protein [Phycisphaerales bacterium]
MRPTTVSPGVPAMLLAGLVSASAPAAPSISAVPGLPDNPFSHAAAVSDSGLVVAESMTAQTGTVPFFWDGTTARYLEVPPELAPFGASVTGISGDGGTVLGTGYINDRVVGVRWDRTGAAQIEPISSVDHARSTAINRDGTVASGVIASDMSPGNSLALVWTADTGYRTITPGQGEPTLSSLSGVSADGLSFVGVSGASVEEIGRPAAWSESAGASYLAAVPRGSGRGQARGISADGSTAFGYQEIYPSLVPAYWDPSGVAHEINRWAGYNGGVATAATDGGELIFGNWWLGPGPSSFERLAFIWDAEHGARPLGEVLASEYGIDMEGWELHIVTGVTPDGRSIIGRGTAPSGFSQGFVVVIPAPGVLPGLLLMGLAGWRRRR